MKMVNVLDKGYVRLVNVMGDELSVVNAARVSYDKESSQLNEKDAKLIKFLWREDHTAPFRHVSMTFEVYAPLMVARQWWKYCVASTHIDDQNGWNESSRRYVTENEEFYVPDVWRSKPANSKQGSGNPVSEKIANQFTELLRQHIERSETIYHLAMESGVAAEQARLFLPAYSMYVRWRWTCSLHSVLHFLAQRLEHDAQFEIQQYAAAIKSLIADKFPNTFEAINNV